MGANPIIQVENLARRYGRRWALSDINFQAREGSVIMVAGRNGSGKSTLFRVLSTAIRPDRGRALVGGFNVLREREDVRKITALLSHYSYLYESLTARENLRVAAEHLGVGRNGLMSILERVNLAQRADDPVSTFSAGMRKRVSFARVLLQQPRVVMLDEPYGQLDPEGFVLVDEVVRELKAKGTTVLIATHQLERGASLADDALMLDAGRVIWSGSARDVLAKDRKREEAC
ncbi:MAG TPA: heme ABC exporter ATP-binding protein CcmA [Thermoanaerobaculia bacterium]